MPSFQIGSSVYFLPDGLHPDSVRESKLSFLDIHLMAAEKAFANGEREGLLAAIRLLREHDPARVWPKWMCDGAASLLEPTAVSSRGGRHANEVTRRRANAVDFIRAQVVDTFLRQGLSKRAAFKAASESIRGTAEGNSEVMEDAHKRFCERIEQNPARYYGLINDLALILMDVHEEPPQE